MKPRWPWLSLVAAGVVLRGWFGVSALARNVLLSTSDGPVDVRIHTPSGHGPWPTVVLVEGLNSTAYTSDAYADALAQAGYLSLSVYLPSDNDVTNVETLAALMNVVPRLSGVDRARLALVSHSLGALESLDVATRDPRIRTVVATGMDVDDALDLNLPDVLLATGRYDAWFTPSMLQKSMTRLTSGRAPRENMLDGQFHRAARGLIISPYADHAGEEIDPVIIRAVIQWLGREFDRPASNTGNAPLSLAGFLLLLGGVVGVASESCSAARTCAVALLTAAWLTGWMPTWGALGWSLAVCSGAALRGRFGVVLSGVLVAALTHVAIELSLVRSLLVGPIGDTLAYGCESDVLVWVYIPWTRVAPLADYHPVWSGAVLLALLLALAQDRWPRLTWPSRPRIPLAVGLVGLGTVALALVFIGGVMNVTQLTVLDDESGPARNGPPRARALLVGLWWGGFRPANPTPASDTTPQETPATAPIRPG